MSATRASDFLANINGMYNFGYLKCHWCGAPCNPLVAHDDVPFLPFQRSTSTAKCPAEHFVCKGCEVYNRKSVTVRFLSEGLKDRQCLRNHSWWMTEDGVWGIRKEDFLTLYDNLFYPPLKFCLSLIREKTPVNLLQLCVINDLQKIEADTELFFTLDNNVLSYTPYELEEALRHGAEGKLPGVRALVELLGAYPFPVDPKEEKKRGRGRPPKDPESTGENPARKVLNKAS